MQLKRIPYVGFGVLVVILDNISSEIDLLITLQSVSDVSERSKNVVEYSEVYLPGSRYHRHRLLR